MLTHFRAFIVAARDAEMHINIELVLVLRFELRVIKFINAKHATIDVKAVICSILFSCDRVTA